MTTELFDHPSLPGLSPSALLLPSRTFSNLFRYSLKFTLTYRLQRFAFRSRSYTSQDLEVFPPYSPLPLLLHTIFPSPFHRNSTTMETPLNEVRIFFRVPELTRCMPERNDSRLSRANFLHYICALDYQQVRDACCHRTSVCYSRGPASAGTVPGFGRP